MQLRRAVRSGLARRSHQLGTSPHRPVYLGVAVQSHAHGLAFRGRRCCWPSLPCRPGRHRYFGLRFGPLRSHRCYREQALRPEILTIAVISASPTTCSESAVTRRLGIPFGVVVAMRLGLAIVGGLAIRLIF